MGFKALERGNCGTETHGPGPQAPLRRAPPYAAPPPPSRPPPTPRPLGHARSPAGGRIARCWADEAPAGRGGAERWHHLTAGTGPAPRARGPSARSRRRWGRCGAAALCRPEPPPASAAATAAPRHTTATTTAASSPAGRWRAGHSGPRPAAPLCPAPRSPLPASPRPAGARRPPAPAEVRIPSSKPGGLRSRVLRGRRVSGKPVAAQRQGHGCLRRGARGGERAAPSWLRSAFLTGGAGGNRSARHKASPLPPPNAAERGDMVPAAGWVRCGHSRRVDSQPLLALSFSSTASS